MAIEQPLVSILIPFKNTEAYLAECLQSILEQTYHHWEVLAVDDHSTDGSVKILELYAARDHRFHLLKNNGRGIIPALQTAYAHCQGTLITRMDSDDIMPSNKLEVLSGSLMKSGSGYLAVGQVRYFSIRGISNGYSRYEHWLNQLTELGKNFTEIYKECSIPSPCWMVFKSDLETCGAFREERYPEDYDLCFRFYRNHLQTIPCTAVLHYWRDYDQRTSRTSPHYAQNYFLDIKLYYFLQLDRNDQRPLVIWGAGTKGKTIAARLIDLNRHFDWLCDNPKKIGKKIYGKPLKHYSHLNKIPNAQSIITVANEKSQQDIQTYLSSMGQRPMLDYFFFC